MPSVYTQKKRSKNQSQADGEQSFVRESLIISLILISIFLTAAIFSFLLDANQENSMGLVGAKLASQLVYMLGWMSFIVPIWSVLLARTLWRGGSPSKHGGVFSSMLNVFFGSILMAICAGSIAYVLVGGNSGGKLGSSLAFILLPYLNVMGSVLFSVSLFLISLSLATGIGGADVISFIKQCVRSLMISLRSIWNLSAVIANFFIQIEKNIEEQIYSFVNLFVPKKKPIVKVPAKKIAKSKIIPEKAIPPKDNFEEQIEIDQLEETEPQPYHRPLIRDVVAINLKQNTKKSIKPPPKKRSGDFQLPPLELLVQPASDELVRPEESELLENCKKLEKTLADFKIGGRVSEVQPGPVITLYEFQPAAGVKVQRIINLADDLALSLKVTSVRVYAPVPGKGTVGIEVPNSQREIVRLREVLSSLTSKEGELNLALGKDTFGEPYVADLCKMPHLLIAGATGTGKSVSINSLLLSLLYKHTPEDLKLILIDPKMLELSIYDKIPHLKSPVVTNPKRARGVFWWAVEEMERRYRLMMDHGVRGIEGYNRLVEGQAELKQEKDTIFLDEEAVVSTVELPLDRSAMNIGASKNGQAKPQLLEKLPRIVIVVDELADLMLSVGKEIEELITRLAQKARAAGIHLILATQRPSVNVITGLIKANFPARISFKVVSRIDSRTVLDLSGAEKLLGQGDMLYMTSGAGKPKRMHAAFVSDKEVHDVTDWLRDHGEPDYDTEIEKISKAFETAPGEKGGGDISRDGEGNYGSQQEVDPLYDEAVSFVMEKGQASTSLVQRMFRIGYNRAARILETMEQQGVVGPADGAKRRDVLVGGDQRI
jgi:S-DNA-T family DNA segregation ATPase FtsK/SpoIIIE